MQLLVTAERRHATDEHRGRDHSEDLTREYFLVGVKELIVPGRRGKTRARGDERRGLALHVRRAFVLARRAERDEGLRRAPAPVLVAACVEDTEEPAVALCLERIAPEPAPALLGVLGRVLRGGVEVAEVDLHVDV